MGNPKPPQRENKDAVTKLVTKELEEAAEDEEREFHLQPWETVPGVPASKIYAGVERDAVEAAGRGQVELLAGLLRPEHPMNKHPLVTGGPIRSRLSSTTWTLVADLLTGKRNPRTGRLKGAPGRPQQQCSRRLARSRSYSWQSANRLLRASLRTSPILVAT